ncbi:MAG: hypothetical protein SFX73_06755 [Kofleriaceae bacterium]|nr:hypothetical protein [Kofleriaceae bacterium]
MPRIRVVSASRVVACTLVLAGCGSEQSAAAPEPTSAPAKAPAPKPSPDTAPPGLKNINKLVIGGDNKDPQMGLFALRAADATQVSAAMKQGLRAAYELAMTRADKAWTGKRNFCSDAVRQTIGYYGIDGMLDDKEWAQWRKDSFAKIKAVHFKAILELHEEMIGEHDPQGCEDSLRTYVEALRYAATNKLELLNFGF